MQKFEKQLIFPSLEAKFPRTQQNQIEKTRGANNLKLPLFFDTKSLNQIENSKAHLIITNILNIKG